MTISWAIKKLKKIRCSFIRHYGLFLPRLIHIHKATVRDARNARKRNPAEV